MVEQDKEYDIACVIKDDSLLNGLQLRHHREDGGVMIQKVKLLIRSVERGSIYFTGAYHQQRRENYLNHLKDHLK